MGRLISTCTQEGGRGLTEQDGKTMEQKALPAAVQLLIITGDTAEAGAGAGLTGLLPFVATAIMSATALHTATHMVSCAWCHHCHVFVMQRAANMLT